MLRALDHELDVVLRPISLDAQQRPLPRVGPDHPELQERDPLAVDERAHQRAFNAVDGEHDPSLSAPPRRPRLELCAGAHAPHLAAVAAIFARSFARITVTGSTTPGHSVLPSRSSGDSWR